MVTEAQVHYHSYRPCRGRGSRYVTIVTERPRYVTMVTGPAEGEALRYHSYIDRDREVTIVTETKTFRLGYHSDKAVTLP